MYFDLNNEFYELNENSNLIIKNNKNVVIYIKDCFLEEYKKCYNYIKDNKNEYIGKI